MYHYDAKIALEELQEEALLPHPVKLRDMILRTKLGPQDAQLLNHDFQDYLTRFGDLQKVARGILEKIAAVPRKTLKRLSWRGGIAPWSTSTPCSTSANFSSAFTTRLISRWCGAHQS